MRKAAGLPILGALILLGALAAQAPAPLDAATGALLARGLEAVGAGPQQGWIATGTATLALPGDSESGPVTVEAWGASHCKITIDFSTPGRERKYEAIANGARFRVQGALALAIEPALGHARGCALLPQGLLWAEIATGAAAAGAGPAAGTVALYRPGQPAALTLGLDPDRGLPTTAAWSEQRVQGRAHQVTVAYADWQAASGASYPSTVTESVDGAVRLSLQITAFAPHPGFTDADFPLPPPLATIVPHGGGQ